MGECRSSRKQAGRDSHHRSSKHTRGHFCVATVHYRRTAQHLCVSNVVGRVACEPAKTQSAQCVESKNLVTTDKAASQLRTYITNIHFVQDLKGERGEWLAAAMVGYDESVLCKMKIQTCLDARASTFGGIVSQLETKTGL